MGAVVVLGVGGLSVLRPDILSFQVGPLVTYCAEDDGIPDADRRIIEQKALGFVRDLLDNQVDGAFSELSREAAKATPVERLRAATAVIRGDGPFGPKAVTRSYLIDLRWGRGFGQTLTCDRDKDSGGGDPPKLGVEPRQANVVIVTSNPKGRQSFTVWMNTGDGEWKIGGFHYQPITNVTVIPPTAK